MLAVAISSVLFLLLQMATIVRLLDHCHLLQLHCKTLLKLLSLSGFLTPEWHAEGLMRHPIMNGPGDKGAVYCSSILRSMTCIYGHTSNAFTVQPMLPRTTTMHAMHTWTGSQGRVWQFCRMSSPSCCRSIWDEELQLVLAAYRALCP